MAIRGPMGGMLRLIGEKQVEMIYQNALRVLEEVGILVKSEAIISIPELTLRQMARVDTRCTQQQVDMLQG